MSTPIHVYFEKAQRYYQRVQANLERKNAITLDLAECIDNLRLIRISVAYRYNLENLGAEEKRCIDQICAICDEAERTWKALRENRVSGGSGAGPAT